MSHGVRWLYAYSLFKLSFAKVTQQVPQVFLGTCLQSLTSPRHGPSALASPSSASGQKDCTLTAFVAKRVTQFLKSQQNILKCAETDRITASKGVYIWSHLRNSR